ncbi:hypothetical protein GCM10018966_019130 [Streptomyces yanii]
MAENVQRGNLVAGCRRAAQSDAADSPGRYEHSQDEALGLAADAGARTVDLTSRPSREAANLLYERAGFRRRESTVYRVTLG